MNDALARARGSPLAVSKQLRNVTAGMVGRRAQVDKSLTGDAVFPRPVEFFFVEFRSRRDRACADRPRRSFKSMGEVVKSATIAGAGFFEPGYYLGALSFEQTEQFDLERPIPQGLAGQVHQINGALAERAERRSL